MVQGTEINGTATWFPIKRFHVWMGLGETESWILYTNQPPPNCRWFASAAGKKLWHFFKFHMSLASRGFSVFFKARKRWRHFSFQLILSNLSQSNNLLYTGISNIPKHRAPNCPNLPSLADGKSSFIFTTKLGRVRKIDMKLKGEELQPPQLCRGCKRQKHSMVCLRHEDTRKLRGAQKDPKSGVAFPIFCGKSTKHTSWKVFVGRSCVFDVVFFHWDVMALSFHAMFYYHCALFFRVPMWDLVFLWHKMGS